MIKGNAKREKASQLKGWFGEEMVNRAISGALDQTIYRSFHNVIIPDYYGMTQIDHTIISPYGIFVIETKNIKGWIFGSERDNRWTQCLRGGKKYSFQNPLRQNFRHTKSISMFLGLPHYCMHSIVLFMGGCEIKTKMPNNVLDSGTKTSIRKEISRDYIGGFKKVYLTDEQIEDAVFKIDELEYDKSLNTQEHLISVKKKKEDSILSEAKKKSRMPKRVWCMGSEFPGSDKLWIKYRE